MSLWGLKLSVFLDLLGKLPNSIFLKLFCSNFSIFQERGGFCSKDDKEPFLCFGFNMFKDNGEGWQNQTLKITLVKMKLI